MGNIKKKKDDAIIFNIDNTPNEILFSYKLKKLNLFLFFIFIVIFPFLVIFDKLYQKFNSFNEFVNYITIPKNIFFILYNLPTSSLLFLITYFTIFLMSYFYILFYKKYWSIKINKLLNEYTFKKGFMGNNIKKGTFTNFSINFDEKEVKKERLFSIFFMVDNKELEKVYLRKFYYSSDSKKSILEKRITLLLNQFRELINKEIEYLSSKQKNNILIINDLKND
ncbi:MAG: hypothetical protein AABZ74_08385 [Cyanobacteriota bacterium]